MAFEAATNLRIVSLLTVSGRKHSGGGGTTVEVLALMAAASASVKFMLLKSRRRRSDLRAHREDAQVSTTRTRRAREWKLCLFCSANDDLAFDRSVKTARSHHRARNQLAPRATTRFCSLLATVGVAAIGGYGLAVCSSGRRDASK